MKILKQICIILGIGALLSILATIGTTENISSYRILNNLIYISTISISLILVIMLIRVFNKLIDELDKY